MNARKKRMPKTSCTAMPSPTFDDALALLLQLEPGDVKGFAQLAKVLEFVSASGSLDLRIVKLIDAARAQVDRFVQGETCDVEKVLTKTSGLLEIASNAREMKVLQNEACQSPKASDIAIALGKRPNPAGRAIPASSVNRTIQSPAEETGASELLPVDADPDLIREFIAESRELLEKSESALLALESNPDEAESINTVFRAFHTVKGTSGFLGLRSISELAHLAESLLTRIRNKEIRLVGGYADLALRSVDMLKKAVASAEGALRDAQIGRAHV